MMSLEMSRLERRGIEQHPDQIPKLLTGLKHTRDTCSAEYFAGFRLFILQLVVLKV